MKKTYTLDEACAYLNVSSGSMADLIATGELPAAKISKSWVLRESDLDSYLAEQVSLQTEQRRAAYQAGRVVKFKPAVAEVRRRLREKPVLPAIPVAMRS
ncbi:MAG TPA: helix-turn-helix domain-containing protein [Gallionella sp.]|jgi:excisionase family DNA binding protein|nr:helix-turn-helix domain-containing protein [Gallionella sp.]